MSDASQDAPVAHAVRVLTIGVYGFDQDAFFDALTTARVDTFCDIRLRRGLRGSTYSFANSRRLQEHLKRLGIRYIHLKELAPPQAVRELQQRHDGEQGVGKRNRNELGSAFVQAYTEECLTDFDAHRFLECVGPDARVVVLFCVEREPEGCHRSIVAKRIGDELGLTPQHLTPP